MKLQTDLLIVSVAAGVALYLIAKSRPGLGLPLGRLAQSGSPDTVYTGLTASQRQGAALREAWSSLDTPAPTNADWYGY